MTQALRNHLQPAVRAIWSIILLSIGATAAGSSYANVLRTGTPVASMPHASAIQDWAAEDSFQVLVKIAQPGISQNGAREQTNTYRLIFTEACYNLRWASRVGLSGSQDRVWAGFDYLMADGQRCSIGAIYRL